MFDQNPQISVAVGYVSLLGSSFNFFSHQEEKQTVKTSQIWNI